MARYRKKALRVRSSGTRTSFPRSVRWLMGLFMGILGVAGIYHLYGTGQRVYDTGQQAHYHLRKPVHERHHQTAEPAVTVEKRSAIPKTHRHANRMQPAAKQAAAQRFEFYQLLPGLEVPLPDPITPAPRVSRPMLPAATKANNLVHQPPHKLASKKTKPVSVYSKQAAPHYMIQAKAYRHREGAEQLKNRLMGLGFKVKSQQVEAEDGTWFRVMLGPFASESVALQQKKQLQQHQVHGILILQR